MDESCLLSKIDIVDIVWIYFEAATRKGRIQGATLKSTTGTLSFCMETI